MASPEQQLPHTQFLCENISPLLSQPRELQLPALIIKQCFLAKLARSPRSDAASPVSVGGLPFNARKDTKSGTGTHPVGPAAPQKQVRGISYAQVAHEVAAARGERQRWLLCWPL